MDYSITVSLLFVVQEGAKRSAASTTIAVFATVVMTSIPVANYFFIKKKFTANEL